MRIARKLIFGDANEEYGRVWDYAEAIKNYSLGSIAIVKCIGSTPMVPTANVTTAAPATTSATPPTTQSSTLMVPTTTASSVAPANNAPTSFQSKGGRKKSWTYGCNKKGAKGAAPRVISTQASSSSQNQSRKM